MTSVALERALRKRLLGHTRILVKDVRSPLGGYAEYFADEPEGTLVIVWDPLQYDLLYVVVHELCHPRLDKALASVGKQEEAAIVGISTAHTEYVRESSRRYTWWKREIKKRLDRTSLRAWLAA